MGRERLSSSERNPFKIEIEREVDGRWIAEIPVLPGVLAYGKTRQEALARVKALALRGQATPPESAGRERRRFAPAPGDAPNAENPTGHCIERWPRVHYHPIGKSK